MTRGDIYRSDTPLRERGHKPGYYLIVSRTFIGENEDVATVVCAPVYSNVLGIDTEVILGEAHGLGTTSAARCDFLTLMLKRRLTKYVGALAADELPALRRALVVALDLE